MKQRDQRRQKRRYIIVNALTSFRLICAFVILFLIIQQGSLYIACALYILCLLSDVLDGHLARRWSVFSKLGFLYDGLADMALTYTELLIIHMWFDLHPVVLLLFILRDLTGFAFLAFHQTWYKHLQESTPWTKIPSLIVLLANVFLLWSGASNQLGLQTTELSSVMVHIILAVSLSLYWTTLLGAMYQFWPSDQEET